MATITEKKLAYLQGTKDAIKNAIIAKGQAVSDTDTFRSYADKIAAISGGGQNDTILLEEQELSFTLNSNYGVYSAIAPMSTNALVIGETYRVKWGEDEFTCVAMDGSSVMSGAVFIGNGSGWGLSGNNEPFLIVGVPSAQYADVISLTDAEPTTRIVKVWQEHASVDLVYVTFKTHDGAKELHRRAVVKGNTCMCPVTGAIKEIDTPTRESTAQYNYTFAGWATTPNGGLDENALKDVTEDRTVYANYIATLRSYTISYYDDDGTLLHSEILDYGSTPSYTPKKDGYVFKGWSPALSPVTGDATYTAIFEELIAFAAASWEDIAEISESGQASMNFSVGDTKMFTWGGNEYKAVVLGFDQDELYDGSGNAGMTIGVMTANPTKTMLNTQYAGVSKYTGWDATQGQKQIETFLRESDLSDIVAVAKNVRKYSYRGDGNEYSAGETFFAFSLRELGLTSKATKHEPYPYFTSNEKRKVMQAGTETYVKYWVRDSRCTSETANNYGSWSIIGESGVDNVSNSGAYCHLVFGFCV